MSRYYIPRHVTQRDPSDPRAMSHCWGACGACCLDAATDGTAKVTAKEFAKMAGGGSGRKTGSGTQEDIVQGLDRYGVHADILNVSPSDLKRMLSTPRRAIFAIATAYEAWPPSLDCMHGEAGPDVNHEVVVIPGATDGKVPVMNPLCFEYQDVPVDDVVQAAAKYAKEQSHSRSIQVVRVYRQKPTGAIADKARIAELEDQLSQWEEYAATVRRLAGDILDVAVPK